MRNGEKGISNPDVRMQNTKKVTNLLYKQGALSKQEIAHALSLSLPTVNLLVSQLREEGLVYMQSADESSGGRIPEIVHFQYEGLYAFGIEITGHHIRLTLINLGGKALVTNSIRVPFRNEKEYWTDLRAILLDTLRSHRVDPSTVLGVGISIPGVVRHDMHYIDFAPTLELRHFDYDSVEDFLGFPILFENEANAAGFAEVWSHGDDISDAIYLSINKGVGGAVIINHQLSYGINRRGGEFGHMTIVPNGEVCSCGKHGCFEAYCSTRTLSASTDDQLSIFFQRLPNNPDYRARWEAYLDNLALAVSNICIAWDVPIIIGGAISPYLENDFQRFVQKVEQLIPFSSNNAYLSLSKNGENAACIGAALMIVAKHLRLLS